VKGGVCVTHGANVKRCSFDGCTNQAKKGGVCITHGAKVKQCSFKGCANQVRKGGVYTTHGAKVKRCSHKGCKNGVIRGGVCKTHGAGLSAKKGCAKKERVGYRHRSKGINSNNIQTLQPISEFPSNPPPHQFIDYEDEEGLNSWIWRSTPMTMRRDALNYASGTSPLLQTAPVVSAPSAYDQETDNEIQGR
jgi:hypothetical protein